MLGDLSGRHTVSSFVSGDFKEGNENGKMGKTYQADIPCHPLYPETCKKEMKTEKWRQVGSAAELRLHRITFLPHLQQVDFLKAMETSKILKQKQYVMKKIKIGGQCKKCSASTISSKSKDLFFYNGGRGIATTVLTGLIKRYAVKGRL